MVHNKLPRHYSLQYRTTREKKHMDEHGHCTTLEKKHMDEFEHGDDVIHP